MASEILWNGDDFMKELEGGLEKNLEKAAIHLTNQIKKKLNRSQPYTIGNGPKGKHYHGQDPSAPGEAPKKIRGDLQRSITYAMGDDKKSAQVGTNLDYGAALELGTATIQPRPFLRSTVAEEGDKIAEIMARTN